MKMLAGGLSSFCKIKKEIEPKPGDKKRISPDFGAHLLPMNVEGSLSSVDPVLVRRRHHLLDNLSATGR